MLDAESEADVEALRDALQVDLDDDNLLTDDELLRTHDILLVWQKPVEYDWVVIARDFVWESVGGLFRAPEAESGTTEVNSGTPEP